MNEELYIEQILDDYFHQKVSRPDTKALLHQKGVADAEKEIDLHHTAAVCIQRYQMHKQVKQVHKHYLEQQRNLKIKEAGLEGRTIRMNGVKWFLRVAAAVLFLAGLWFAWLYINTSNTTLYAEIYQPYNLYTNRANIDEIVPHKMIEEFKEKNYTAVIKTYRNIALSNNREKFLAAVSYQESGNPVEAIKLLNEILVINKQQQSRFYNDEAEFYLALNYLKLNDMKQAIPLFQKIYDDPDHTFHERIGTSALKKIKWLD